MYHTLFKKLQALRQNWKNEEELRQGWIFGLTEVTNINFHAERQKKDSSYNNVIIEFKAPGHFKGRTTSRAFKEAIYDRLFPYISRTSKFQSIDPSDFIGIAIDGDHLCFAQVKEGLIEHGPLLPLSEVSVTMVVNAVKGSLRRALIAENLIEDFGHKSDCGIQMMSALAEVLSFRLSDSHNNKAKMLFEEWRTLFGQVADLSIEQIEAITKSLRFELNTSKDNKIPGALFVIHTYNSLIIKLLAAEIVSTHNLTSYKFFAQNLSVESDQQVIIRLENEIERALFFSSAGIDGFVEEALFSWYLDVCKDNEKGGDIIKAIRGILLRLSFYRTDNLTQAKSRDLLKLFYQNLVPESLRKTLGEFYTPDWLVSFTLNKVGNIDWLANRSLDPTCGSGSFLLEIIRRKTAAAKKKGLDSDSTLDLITSTVWGFDLNPLAVQTARVNFLIAIADLLKDVPGKRIEIPILLADAIYSPARDPLDHENLVRYTIGSEIANLEITIPAELAFDRKKLDLVFELLANAVESESKYDKVEVELQSRNILSEAEAVEWRKPLKNTYGKVLKLHKKNWNGIWFRIIRNFFWSSTAGKFDLIAGNPPWVRWSKLPITYRERVKPTCMNYNIFSSTPHHGGNELDISGMITYTVSDKWLSDNGKLAFIITQTHFQSPSSEGFRDFKIDDTHTLVPLSVDDLKSIKPFPDATNKTAVAVFQKGNKKVINYPIEYTLWKIKDGFPRTIPVSSSLDEVEKLVSKDVQEATPVTRINSPWAILPKGRFRQLKNLVGKCDWVQGRKGITADLNGIYFVEIIAVNSRSRLVKIRTRPEAGKTLIGPAQEFWVESDLLYPLIKGASDFSRCYFKRQHSLYTFIPNKGIVKEAYDLALAEMNKLRHTSAYFKNFKTWLQNRSTFRGRMKNAPYFAVYNVGEYTFSPHKVIWAEQKDFCAAVVSSEETPFVGPRPYVPDHKIFFAEFKDFREANFLCALLNSNTVMEFVKSHNISIQIGDIFKHMQLPSYISTNPKHETLAQLSIDCHNEPDSSKRQLIINRINKVSEEIVGI